MQLIKNYKAAIILFFYILYYIYFCFGQKGNESFLSLVKK